MKVRGFAGAAKAFRPASAAAERAAPPCSTRRREMRKALSGEVTTGSPLCGSRHDVRTLSFCLDLLFCDQKALDKREATTISSEWPTKIIRNSKMSRCSIGDRLRVIGVPVGRELPLDAPQLFLGVNAISDGGAKANMSTATRKASRRHAGPSTSPSLVISIVRARA